MPHRQVAAAQARALCIAAAAAHMAAALYKIVASKCEIDKSSFCSGQSEHYTRTAWLHCSPACTAVALWNSQLGYIVR